MKKLFSILGLMFIIQAISWITRMVLIPENWAAALEPGIREWFFLGAKRRPSLIETFFNVQDSAKAEEHIHGAGAVGIDAWDNYQDSGTVSSVTYDPNYKTTFTNKTKIVELPIKREFVEDNLYNQILIPAQQLGDSASLKREVDAASVFNNAFSTSFLGADGKPLCEDAHPYSPSKTGSTQDNEFALALTAENVSTIRQAMQKFKDDNGNIIAVMPDLLIVPPDLEDQAAIITKSPLKTGSMDNDINPQLGRFRYELNHYLTDANAWFMVDSMLMKQHLFWFNRIPLDIRLKNQDASTFAVYVARMRYSFGWSDWRWIAGSNPS